MFVRVSGQRSWLKPSSENQIKFDWFINDTFIHMSQPIKHFPITRVSFVPRPSLYGCVSEQGNDHSAQMGIKLNLHFTCVGNGEESSVWTRQIQLLSQISLVYGQSHVYVGQESGLHKLENCKHFSEMPVKTFSGLPASTNNPTSSSCEIPKVYGLRIGLIDTRS